MNTIFNARSIDAFQKASGNLVAIVLLSKKIAKQIAKNLKVPVDLNTLDGIITDAHIYQETINDAKELVNSIKRRVVTLEKGEVVYDQEKGKYVL